MLNEELKKTKYPPEKKRFVVALWTAIICLVNPDPRVQKKTKNETQKKRKP